MSHHPGHGTSECVHGYVLSRCRCFENSVIHLVACPQPSTPEHDAVVAQAAFEASESLVETRTRPTVPVGYVHRLRALQDDLGVMQARVQRLIDDVEDGS